MILTLSNKSANRRNTIGKAIVFLLLLITVTGASAHAGWLIYHEPAFKGTVLDIDTKKPIEGAVVVAVYRKATMGSGVGSIDSIINVRETLTDSSGNFHIPSYTTLIQPFSWQISSTVIILKPGYACVEECSWHFVGRELAESQERGWFWSKELRYILRGDGIVELPKTVSREEQLNSLPIIPGPGVPASKMRILLKLHNELATSLGLSPIQIP